MVHHISEENRDAKGAYTGAEGDSRPEAIDIYIHIGPEDLRISYLAHMPRLGLI
jgi:hypothetical protein